jgi:signal transduction histidine kinase
MKKEKQQTFLKWRLLYGILIAGIASGGLFYWTHFKIATRKHEQHAEKLIESFNSGLLIELSREIEKVLGIIEKEGLERATYRINANKLFNSKLYMFVYELRPPYKLVAHGKLAGFVGKSPRDFQTEIYETITQTFGNLYKVIEDLAFAAEKEKGYWVYRWKNGIDEPSRLKVAYVKTFKDQGKKYFIGTGYYLL